MGWEGGGNGCDEDQTEERTVMPRRYTVIKELQKIEYQVVTSLYRATLAVCLVYSWPNLFKFERRPILICMPKSHVCLEINPSHYAMWIWKTSNINACLGMSTLIAFGEENWNLKSRIVCSNLALINAGRRDYTTCHKSNSKWHSSVTTYLFPHCRDCAGICWHQMKL